MSLIDDLFIGKGKQLYWRRIENDHVDPVPSQDSFVPDQTYFVVRMTGMYLARTRILWRKYYPMLHGFVASAGQQEHVIVDPGQLRELGNANLDRVVIMNYRLFGPLPYRDEDVGVTVGLYAVPGQDAAKALLATVGSLAALGGLALGQAQQVAQVVKEGVESILSLGETKLQLGIRDTFFQNNRLQPGYHVGIAASKFDIDNGRLWLSRGALVSGEDPRAGTAFTDYDYMVIEIERQDARDDWPRLPGLQDFEKQFADIMRDGTTTTDQKRAKLSTAWPSFQQALHDSLYLVTPDRERIAVSVAADLNKRLEALESRTPFETRGWGGRTAVATHPGDFDFLDVDDRIEAASPASQDPARTALRTIPF